MHRQTVIVYFPERETERGEYGILFTCMQRTSTSVLKVGLLDVPPPPLKPYLLKPSRLCRALYPPIPLSVYLSY